MQKEAYKEVQTSSLGMNFLSRLINFSQKKDWKRGLESVGGNTPS